MYNRPTGAKNAASQHEKVNVVLLANQPRMFREMLHRALNRVPGKQLTIETDDPACIPEIVSRVDADWLIVTLTEKAGLPALVEKTATRHPTLSIMGISTDGRHVEIQSSSAGQRDVAQRRYTLDDISLADLFTILGQE